MDGGAGYRAAVEGAAMFDRPGRGKIAVAGVDRLTYLHAMLTGEVQPLAAGSGCYSAYLTPQGRMITDMRILELGDLAMLDLPAAATRVVLEKLDQFIFSEDVKLGDLTEAFESITVAGPRAAAVVSKALASGGQPALAEDQLGAWREFANARASLGGEMVLVAATSELGLPGFDLYVERQHAGALRAALQAAGAEAGSAEAAETLRIEAGRPAFGIDMDTETIPLEAGIEERAISFTKGCYPGQEVIIRIVHRGQGRVAKRLAGLRVEGGTVPPPGAIVRSGEREAGKVTSAAFSPRAGSVIALAMLHRDFQQAGTAVTIDADRVALQAAVAAVPFVPAP